MGLIKMIDENKAGMIMGFSAAAASGFIVGILCGWILKGFFM